MAWFRAKAAASDSWTSVRFFPGRAEIAEVSPSVGGARPAVRSWESFAVDRLDAAALKRLRGKIRGRCTLLLNHGQYQILQTDTPAVPREEMANALRWRVKDMVDFPVEQAGIDVLPIPAEGAPGRTAQVYVVAASHSVLMPAVRLFQDAGIGLDAIDIPELAQRNVGALFEAERRGLAMLAFDELGGRLTFTFGGELYVTRHIEVTATELARVAGDATGGLYERALLDVQRSLDNFDRNYNAITLSKLLVAPIPGAAGFIDYLKGNLYQPVETLDLAAALDLQRVPAVAASTGQAQAMLAIGAALRQEHAA
jgi:MSHA biogenesis protein MshI